ncbi:hypothetical protein K502DRAFT_325348, partial [Neoconidiobolus thromboides FSU 785]
MKVSILITSLLSLVVAHPDAIWPKVAKYTAGNSTLIVGDNFKITANTSCDRLNRVIGRYQNLVITEKWVPVVPTFRGSLDSRALPSISELKVNVKDTNNEYDDKTDEQYTLTINDKGASINAQTVYGAIRGLESFTQLVEWNKNHGLHFVTHTPLTIEDAPKFSHRGLLLDSSRNFFPIKDIKRTIDALSYNKMNVLHWHLTDSHSWPFKSEKHPKLWQTGAIFPDQTYSFAEIAELIEYGLDRGVRIIPELEAPAHSYAIGKAYPEVAVCMDDLEWDVVAAQPVSGQIDPTNPKSVAIVNDLIDEFSKVFKDKYLHLSGDEVNYKCWNTSEKIRNYVRDNKVTLESLLNVFAEGMHKRAIENKKSIMVWEEIILQHNVTLPKDSLVQVWLGAEDTKKVIERGYRVVASSYQYWYLDCGRGTWVGDAPSGGSWCDPFKHWQMVYTYDLLKNLNADQQKLVAGGEVTVWSEQVDEVNLDRFAWPRTSAAAEVLWSGNRDASGKVVRTKPVVPRFNNFRFKMVSRGINADATQPLWCVVNPGRCDSTSSLKQWTLPYEPKA